MNNAFDLTDLTELATNGIILRTMKEADIDAIARAICDPEGWNGRVWGMDTIAKTRDILFLHLDSYRKGNSHPFVYFKGSEVAGISVLHSFVPRRKALEIGHTCVAPKFRRTSINTQVKKLLLEHSFEKLEAVRVELRVDERNYHSQMAVLRIGAVFEGKIRHWQVRKEGELPDGMLYSLTNKEWPLVKERLQDLLVGNTPCFGYLPHSIHSSCLQLRLFKISDAEKLLELTRRNSKCLEDSFPRIAKIQTIQDAQAFIAKMAHDAAAGTAFYYGIWQGQNLIGQFQVKNIQWDIKCAELGYFIDGDYRRHGIASEAALSMLKELLDIRKFNRIIIRSLVGNQASISFAEKLGFEREGIMHSAFMTGNGILADIVLLAKWRLS